MDVHGVGGVQLDCLIKVQAGSLVVAHLVIHEATTIVGRSVVHVYTQGFVEIVQPLL